MAAATASRTIDDESALLTQAGVANPANDPPPGWRDAAFFAAVFRAPFFGVDFRPLFRGLDFFDVDRLAITALPGSARCGKFAALTRQRRTVFPIKTG
jgi:hypothetical protein